MYYCKACGALTEGSNESEVMLPEVNGEQPAVRDYYTACSECGSTDIEEAHKCKVCGEYITDGSMDFCMDCKEEMFENFWMLAKDVEDDPQTSGAQWGDIVELMAITLEDFYDKYRFMEE